MTLPIIQSYKQKGAIKLDYIFEINSALKVHIYTATEVFLIFLNPLFFENFIRK